MASKLSQEISTFGALKEEPEMTVNSIAKKTEERLIASDAPIAVDPESFVQHIKQATPQDKYLVQDISAKFGPYFYKLPRELRDQIFSQLVASGNPAFMRTSSAMEQEGKMLIAKEGVYRLNLGYDNRTNCQPPSAEVGAGIQNLEIRVNHATCSISIEDTMAKYPETKVLDLFAGPTPHRKTCTVMVDSLLDGDSRRGGFQMVRKTLAHKVLARPEFFRGFEKVVVRNGMGWTTALPRSHSELLTRRFRFEWARKYLEPCLGEADRGDEGILTFYPRKAQGVPPSERSSGCF